MFVMSGHWSCGVGRESGTMIAGVQLCSTDCGATGNAAGLLPLSLLAMPPPLAEAAVAKEEAPPRQPLALALKSGSRLALAPQSGRPLLLATANDSPGGATGV